jgi:hypothetical protein
MSGFETALKEAAKTNRARCGVSLALEKLPPKDRHEAEAALRNGLVKGAHIAKALSALSGQHVAAFTVNRHRSGSCSCEL